MHERCHRTQPGMQAGRLQRECAGASPEAAAGRAPVTGAGSGRGQQEEARLREAVLGEVLQRGSSVRWADVAGLESAKQVRTGIWACIDCNHTVCPR